MEEKGEIGIASIHAALAGGTNRRALSWRDVSFKLMASFTEQNQQ